PLIIRGARQTGKTWLMEEFGKKFFEEVVYINLETDEDLSTIFDRSIEPNNIIDMLGAYYGKKIKPNNTLVIFDEIQQAPRALTSLKYFSEKAPEYFICCAGSFLGIALHNDTSFPVGKVDFLDLQPLNFQEFLIANDQQAVVDFISSEFNSIPDAFSNKLTDILKQYFIIGGMPAAVSEWLKSRDYSAVEEKQTAILDSYEQDFSKHSHVSTVTKMRYLWNSIPSQLAKENKKFIYGLARKGARARDFEEALLLLFDSGLIRKVGRLKKPAFPLKAYEDLKSFKIYHLDIGLLRTLGKVPPEAIIKKNELFSLFNGSLTEQYVLQELSSQEKIKNIYYWTSGRTAEVDFVFDLKDNIFPLEVKSGKNPKAKSLRVYREKYMPTLAIRTSPLNLKLDGDLLNIPLYSLFNLRNIIEYVLRK
ncbi:MAG: ATP-binding protein, partial [Candidatus Humimicrobiaceae bacterium]